MKAPVTSKPGAVLRRFLWLVIPVILSACGPRLQSPSGHIAMPELTDAGFIASDGRLLKVSRWVPPDGELKAALIGLHGFNDYRNAFAIPAEEFVDHGVGVLAFDQRGFGESESTGIWAGSDRMVRDAVEFTALVTAEFSDIPVFLLGDSMGGAVAMLATLESDASGANGLILAAPAVWGWSEMNLFYRVSLWLSAHIFPAAKVTGRGLDIMPSDNIEMLKALGRDPLVIKETRIDAIYGLVNLMDKALDAGADINQPVLLLYGQSDEVIPSKSIRRLRDRLGRNVEYTEFPSGYHMLLRDCGRQAVIDRILTFIESRGNRKNLPKVIDSSRESGSIPLTN